MGWAAIIIMNTHTCELICLAMNTVIILTTAFYEIFIDVGKSELTSLFEFGSSTMNKLVSSLKSYTEQNLVHSYIIGSSGSRLGLVTVSCIINQN